MDNNWLANEEWFFETSDWIIDKKLKLIEHGMDIRLLNPQIAEQISKLRLFRNIKFAYDHISLEEHVKKGISLLKDSEINVRSNVLFYVYVDSDLEYESGVKRCRQLKEWGTTPFVMFNNNNKRTKRIRKLQRWANRPEIFWSIDIDHYA
jgi:uncharacterized protein YecE (DUF72 family)